MAARAGLTRGALQYQFPDPHDLFVAVVEALYAAQVDTFSVALSGAASPRDRFAAMIETAVAMHDSEGHIAFLELWTAARTDAALRSRIEPIVTRVEAAIDEGVVATFADTGIAARALVDLRRLLQATLRGLAVGSHAVRRDARSSEASRRRAQSPILRTLRDVFLAAATNLEPKARDTRAGFRRPAPRVRGRRSE